MKYILIVLFTLSAFFLLVLIDSSMAERKYICTIQGLTAWQNWNEEFNNGEGFDYVAWGFAVDSTATLEIYKYETPILHQTWLKGDFILK